MFKIPPNITRDYNKVQGTTHPTDLSYQIIRDYNIRYVTIQNSGPVFIGIGITTYPNGQTPDILITLKPGEIRHIAINSIGDALQYLWIISPETRMIVGEPSPFHSNANDFVLRYGMNAWWVQRFHRPSYAAAK